jgi:glycosyltransferase involved in cell wall biosynthesis
VRICIVSKFPPIEGGIAARTYWRVRHLLETGHRVAVVTNSGGVEPEYRIAGCEDHLAWLRDGLGLVVRDSPGPVPWHIPESPAYLERLLNELLTVLRSSDWDVVESDYLVPYGIAGHLASRMVGLPHVVRHGGSDLGKFLDHPGFAILLREVLASAQEVITDVENAPRLRQLGASVTVAPVYEVDRAVFSSEGRRHREGPPVYAFVGKVNHHWRRKGLDSVARWYANQPKNSVRLKLIGQGRGVGDFTEWARKELGADLVVEPFVPPWEMPGVFREIDWVFALSVDDPIANVSMLAAEAEASGCGVIRTLEQLRV